MTDVNDGEASASRGSNALQLFLLAHGVGSDVAFAGFGQFIDDAVPIVLQCPILGAEAAAMSINSS